MTKSSHSKFNGKSYFNFFLNTTKFPYDPIWPTRMQQTTFGVTHPTWFVIRVVQKKKFSSIIILLSRQPCHWKQFQITTFLILCWRPLRFWTEWKKSRKTERRSSLLLHLLSAASPTSLLRFSVFLLLFHPVKNLRGRQYLPLFRLDSPAGFFEFAKAFWVSAEEGRARTRMTASEIASPGAIARGPPGASTSMEVEGTLSLQLVVSLNPDSMGTARCRGILSPPYKVKNLNCS